MNDTVSASDFLSARAHVSRPVQGVLHQGPLLQKHIRNPTLPGNEALSHAFQNHGVLPQCI